MFEIVAVLVFVLVVLLVLVLLPILLIIRAAQRLFKPVDEVVSAVQEAQERKWRQASAFERERMVRVEEGWRIIGRVVGAGCCAVGTILTFPMPAGIVFGLLGYRLLKPIRREMRDACAYRSTGAQDEPLYSPAAADNR